VRALVLVGVCLAHAGCGRFGFDPITGAGGDGATDRYSAAVLADHPVAYWRLDETAGTVARDELGGHPAMYQGQCQLGVPGAIAGDTAVRFDGASCRIDAGDFFALASGTPFTIELWADIELADATARFLVNRNTLSGSDNGYQIVFQTGHIWYERLVAAGGDGYMETGAPALGRFELLAVTYDGTTERFYRDGSEVASMTWTSPQTLAPGGLAFGDTARRVSLTFDGVLDEIALYSTAVPAARLAAHVAARN
jgi:hypothetical protein